MTQHYQNIVIGFGKGGKTLAKTLASRQEQVLLIEASPKMYGGTCINIGCIPSKTLIEAAGQGLDFEAAAARKAKLIAALNDKNYHMIADEASAEVWTGWARFTGNHSLEVTLTDGQTRQVTGDRIFINTGAKTALPAIPGLEGNDFVLTSTEALDLQKLPKRLVVVGAGYIGLEMADMFRTFGSEVTVLDIFDRFIPREEPEIAAQIKADMEAAGLTFYLGIQDLAFDGGTVTYNYQGQSQRLEADAILVAAGRRPNTAQLGLENTDIELDAQGAVVVNKHLETAVPGVYALGDVKGGPQFTYVSLDDFRIVKDQLWGDKSRKVSDRNLIPYTVFLQTPLSHVGLTEAQAVEAGHEVLVFGLPMAAVPKAKVIGNDRGSFKIIVNKADQTILGATHYGVMSPEVINFLALAIKTKVPYTEIRDFLFTHPTIAEALNDVLKQPK